MEISQPFDESIYIPYIGATSDVNLGTHNFLTTGTLGAGKTTITSNDQTPLLITGTFNGYMQLNIKNLSSVSTASSDLVMTANTGSETARYMDIGINGSGGGVAPFTTALEGYIYHIDNNLNIGAFGTSKFVKIYCGTYTSPTLIATFGPTGLILANDLFVTEGGTGASAFTAYGVIVGGTTTTGALQSTAAGTAGQVLLGAGVSAKPVWSTGTWIDATGTITLTPNGGSGDPYWLSPTGKFGLGGTGMTNNETLLFDFETTANAVDISSPTSANNLTLTGMNFSILSDSLGLRVGAGTDMSVIYNGTVGVINTALVAASDLQINCGTDKTLILNETVWDDIQFPLASGKVPAANFPVWETFTTNTEAYSFTVDDRIQLQANEPPHGWKEGTVGVAHIHLTQKTAQSTGSDRFAKFELIFAYADYNGIWTEQAAITQEVTIPTGSSALQQYLLTFASTVTFTGLHLGTQIKCRIRRIAATGGTEYADKVYVTQVGVHIEEDTIGSRTTSGK